MKYNGEQISIPIPPIYLDNHIKRQLKETLKAAIKDYQLAEASGISLKLLAVLSGLGKYGRNTLCYMKEYGSFCNFEAYYTDIPCEDKNCEITYMAICDSCGLCKKNCPTGAIGGKLVIDASRCLTMQNEFSYQMPDWLSPDIHHALIGCIRCQEVCPINKSLPPCRKEILELNEAESEALLELPPEKLPPEIVEKFLSLGYFEWFIRVVGRNAKLAIESMRL